MALSPDDLAVTAVAEVSHYRARFLARTHEPEIDVDLRWIQADLRQPVHDLRNSAPTAPRSADLSAVYDSDHYAAGQTLGRALRAAGSAALAYHSVRLAGGQCVVVFIPRALSNARSVGHSSLHWDGQCISHWFEKSEPHARGLLSRG